MLRVLFKTAICCLLTLGLAEMTTAQQFAKMTDEYRIELALDLLRKSVQQEDTVKVVNIFASQVKQPGAGLEQKEVVIGRLQSIFDNSASRMSTLKKRPFAQAGNILELSNLNDFDILSPAINIVGDSAFVDCELVLWSAPGGPGHVIGSRITERLVFVSPTRVETIPDDEDFKTWDEMPSSGISFDFESSRKPWILVGYDNLFEFLSSYGISGLKALGEEEETQ